MLICCRATLGAQHRRWSQSMRASLALCFIVLFAVPVAAQTDTALKNAFTTRSEAQKAGDVQTWSHYTTDDAVTIQVDGIVTTKQQRATFIGSPAQRMPGPAFTESDRVWRVYDGGAVETFRLEFSGFKPIMVTRLWVKTPAAWKVASEQWASIQAPVLAAALTTLAQRLPDLRRPEDLAHFMDTYYQHPRPELIGRAIELLPSSPDMTAPLALGSTMAFFSEVFLANPDRVAEWQATTEKQDARTKWFLSRAIAWSKAGGVLNVEGHSAAINDFYWGAFFATGKSVFIERLTGEMKYAEERNNAELWGAGASAKWSLSSNARQHPLVLTILQSEIATGDRQTQALITEVLTRDPQDFQREMKETVARQHAAGKWK
jgi:hypothetical protein